MPTQDSTYPRQRFLVLVRALNIGDARPKDEATATCEVSCKFKDVQFTMRHPEPESEELVLEMPLGKLPAANVASTLEKLLALNLALLRQFGPSIGLRKDGEVVFRSRDSLATLTGDGLQSSLEALRRIRTSLGDGMKKRFGAAA